jgi:membrane-associated phospholipid phosphatase
MGSYVAATLLALGLAAPLPGETPSPPPSEAPDAAASAAAPAEATQAEPRTGFLRQLGHDFRRTLTSRDSLSIFGVGGLAALAVSPLDQSIQGSRFNSRLHDATRVEAFFEGGHYAGGAAVQIGGSVAVLAAGKLAGSTSVAELGSDLVRAQIVSGVITQALKVATSRERPDGTSHLSFPSGHASGAFATAAVLQRRYGLKIGVPAYGVAAWVAASRLNRNRHYLSDVTFGAAVGIATGRAVTFDRGSKRVTISPQMAPGGGAALQVTLTSRP